MHVWYVSLAYGVIPGSSECPLARLVDSGVGLRFPRSRNNSDGRSKIAACEIAAHISSYIVLLCTSYILYIIHIAHMRKTFYQ